MQFKNLNVYFFFLILAGVTILTYFVIQPFLVPFLVAGILAYLFSPAYDFFLKITRKKGIASLLSCLLVAFIIILPLFFVASLVVNEVQDILNDVSYDPQSIRNKAESFSSSLSVLPFAKFSGAERIFSGETFLALAKSFSQNALKIFQGVYQGVAHFVFVVFILFFSLFYLFMDGKNLAAKLIRLSPLQDKYDRILIQRFSSIVRATIKGTLLIAVLQGFLSGILFWASGVFPPVILGILATVSSVIPSIGSGLVWFPVGIIMLVAGNFTQGMTVLLVGALVISTVDNFIRPKLVGRDTQMHPLMILFSSLGGISLFGISGFLVGPILMSLFVAMLEIYALEFKNQIDEYNQ